MRADGDYHRKIIYVEAKSEILTNAYQVPELEFMSHPVPIGVFGSIVSFSLLAIALAGALEEKGPTCPPGFVKDID